MVGSTRAARHAGMAHAIIATLPRTVAIPMSVSGSCPDPPNSSVSYDRCAEDWRLSQQPQRDHEVMPQCVDHNRRPPCRENADGWSRFGQRRSLGRSCRSIPTCELAKRGRSAPNRTPLLSAVSTTTIRRAQTACHGTLRTTPTSAPVHVRPFGRSYLRQVRRRTGASLRTTVIRRA